MDNATDIHINIQQTIEIIYKRTTYAENFGKITIVKTSKTKQIIFLSFFKRRSHIIFSLLWICLLCQKLLQMSYRTTLSTNLYSSNNSENLRITLHRLVDIL